MKTQTQQVLAMLQQGIALTQAEAANLIGCWRLGARIHELRQAGYPIVTVSEAHQGGRHARYKLEVQQ